MIKPEIPTHIEELLYAEEHRLLDDAVGGALHRCIQMGILDNFVVGQLHHRVEKHFFDQLRSGPFRLSYLRTGEILLGHDLDQRPVLVPLQFFNGHSLCLSGSGGGKTFKSRWLALQIGARVPAVWLFDLRKRELGLLRPLFGRMGIDLIIVPARMLRLNPLQIPDGVQPWEWASRVSDLLVQVLRLPPRADKLLHAAILAQYEHFGVFRGGGRFPTMFELREAIAANKEANPQARQAIVDTLDPILMSLRDVLSYRRGWSTSELAKVHLVFELGGIADAEKDLILNTLLYQEFTSRITSGISNPRMNLWICCDEAGRILSSANTTGGLNDLISLVRGTGIGLDLSVQSADVTPSILSNTAMKFIGRCGSAADYEIIGSAMGLTVEQRRYLAHTLVPGMFVGQVGEGDWRHPFLFRIPTMDFSNVQPVADPVDLRRALPQLESDPS